MLDPHPSISGHRLRPGLLIRTPIALAMGSGVLTQESGALCRHVKPTGSPARACVQRTSLYSGVEITAYNQHIRPLPARALVVSQPPRLLALARSRRRYAIKKMRPGGRGRHKVFVSLYNG